MGRGAGRLDEEKGRQEKQLTEDEVRTSVVDGVNPAPLPDPECRHPIQARKTTFSTELSKQLC